MRVAADEGFEEVVYEGVVEDAAAIRAHDHTVNVDLDGHLDPGSEYYYRFVHDGVASRVGRCRTLPAPGTSPDSVRFAVLACQDYQNGYYGAYHHVAEEDVDFLVHVGDFIYESAAGEFTGLGSYDYPGREMELPNGRDRVRDLEDYRYIYRQYRSDEFLQEALESHTLIAGWDDHEMVNDVYWDYRTDAPAGDHPRGDDPEFMTHLIADAMHAWWEYMPARVHYDPGPERLQDRFELWRTFEFGDLVDLVMTDERLFRDPPKHVPGLIPTREATAPKYEDPDRSMLGESQRDWLVDQLTGSDATWTVWTDEVLTIPFKLGAGPFTIFPVQGGWDGYVRERRRILEALDAADTGNFVTLTGDAHCYIAGYQQTKYDDTFPGLLFGTRFEDSRVGVEFMTPTVTSLNVAEALGLNRGRLARWTEPLLSRLVTAMNPHMEFFNSHRWGYSVVEFTREDCTYTAYSVDKTVDSADVEKDLVTRLRVPEGRVEIRDVTD